MTDKPTCGITGNPVGTDTWAVDDICACAQCRRYVAARLRELETTLNTSEKFHRVAVQQRDRNQRELDEARDEANKLAESLDYYESLTMCDCCESMTDSPVEADGHVQCESCTKLANARAEIATINERLREEILKRGKVEREVERLRAQTQVAWQLSCDMQEALVEPEDAP